MSKMVSTSTNWHLDDAIPNRMVITLNGNPETSHAIICGGTQSVSSGTFFSTEALVRIHSYPDASAKYLEFNVTGELRGFIRSDKVAIYELVIHGSFPPARLVDLIVFATQLEFETIGNTVPCFIY